MEISLVQPLKARLASELDQVAQEYFCNGLG